MGDDATERVQVEAGGTLTTFSAGSVVVDRELTGGDPHRGSHEAKDAARIAGASGPGLDETVRDEDDCDGAAHAVTRKIPLHYPVVLGTCTALFVLRVLGQAVAAVWNVGFLPPFEQWYSGLVPYPLLLGSQIAIAALMLGIVADFARGEGFFVSLRPRTGRILVGLGALHALAMVARYVVTMAAYPERRWFTGTIPIWFHLVLAAFVLTLGLYQLRRDATATAGKTP